MTTLYTVHTDCSTKRAGEIARAYLGRYVGASEGVRVTQGPGA